MAKCFEEASKYLVSFTFSEEENNTLFPIDDGAETIVETAEINGIAIPWFINEYWTARQRQAASIHEISYRACFKAQLPRFFIELLTERGDTVYDPFSGRGTTVIEAGLLGRRVISNDINPLSKILTYPRLAIPSLAKVEARLDEIEFDETLKADLDLSMFYHPKTEAEIVSLQRYLDENKGSGCEDDVDHWIRMVATNRLTGHSSGFFSVYTLPPNQAVSQESQVKINNKRKQKPDYRNTKKIIMRKTMTLLKNMRPDQVSLLRKAAKKGLFLENDAAETGKIADESVSLTVTSPPFLDIVQYSKDNWLRCWFNNLDTQKIEKQITMARTVEDWSAKMGQIFEELYRITKPGGWVAFEVGEVRKGKVRLDDQVIPLGLEAGFKCLGVVVNSQQFTKTANIWGVNNNLSGTNSNRIVLFNKC
ncbi:MAG: DNA methyltransferase [Bacillota bacterium]